SGRSPGGASSQHETSSKASVSPPRISRYSDAASSPLASSRKSTRASSVGELDAPSRRSARCVRTMSSRVRLRPARVVDARQLRDWRNEAETRAASFDSTPIAWESHVRWLEGKLADPNVRVLIATDESGEDVGFVRLDADGDAAEISVSIDRSHRGRGIGTQVIREAATFALAELGVRWVVAHIKSGNTRSIRAFTGAGFPRPRHARDDVVELVFVSEEAATESPGPAGEEGAPRGRHG